MAYILNNGTEVFPFKVGQVYDGHEILEIMDFDPTDDEQPFNYFFGGDSDPENCWIPLTEKGLELDKGELNLN